MNQNAGNILITGIPGVGKTTLIRRLCESLRSLQPVGFYTEEIREAGSRKGFDLVSLSGQRQQLAHVGIRSALRVGKYDVDVAGFESFLKGNDFIRAASRLIVIDEIGKMECYSDAFRHFLTEALSSDHLVIATIALKGGGVIRDVKQRPDVTLLEMTRSNRDGLLVTARDLVRAHFA